MQIFNGHPEMLIFVDETGAADRRNYLRRFGYSIRPKGQASCLKEAVDTRPASNEHVYQSHYNKNLSNFSP